MTMQVTEIATVIFIRKNGIKRRKQPVIALYMDGELFEYSEDSVHMEHYIDGFSEGIAVKKPDGSVQFVKGTAQLLDGQEPPMRLDEVVTRGISWERTDSNEAPANGIFSRI